MVPHHPLHVRLDSYRDVHIRVHCEETVSDLTDVLHKMAHLFGANESHDIHESIDSLDMSDEDKAAVKAKADAETLAERQAKAADLKAQLDALGDVEAPANPTTPEGA
jgi:hypothetical protein